MDPNDDLSTSRPSDNFAYKNDAEKSELQGQMFSARLSLELKLLLLLLALGLLVGGGNLLITYFSR